MKFTKMQGCGNDYIYINCFHEKAENPRILSKLLSDRHFGIGADGLVLIKESEIADFMMQIYNSDGTPAEMCGNAIRCVGKYVYEHKMTDKTEMKIETLAGVRKLRLNISEGKVSEVTVNMGIPVASPKAIPVLSEKNIVIHEEIIVNDTAYYMTCISMGNPHAVIFVDDIKNVNLELLGPKFEFHRMFPNRVNVEFVQILDRNHITMRVWERGAGETMACGTGACAAVAAGIMEEILSTDVIVNLPGGTLKIYYDCLFQNIYMTGPAIEIYHGTINLEE